MAGEQKAPGLGEGLPREETEDCRPGVGLWAASRKTQRDHQTTGDWGTDPASNRATLSFPDSKMNELGCKMFHPQHSGIL